MTLWNTVILKFCMGQELRGSSRTAVFKFDFWQLENQTEDNLFLDRLYISVTSISCQTWIFILNINIFGIWPFVNPAKWKSAVNEPKIKVTKSYQKYLQKATQAKVSKSYKSKS